MNLQYDLRAIAPHLQIAGILSHAEGYGSGHINDTYCLTFEQVGVRDRY